MNIDVAVPSVPPAPITLWLMKLRKQRVIVRYVESQIADTFDIGLSNLPAKFPFQLGQLAAKLERLLPNNCALMTIKFGSTHPTLGDKCTVSLSLYCREYYPHE